METEVLRYLKKKPKGSASVSEIVRELSLETTDQEVDSMIERLYYGGLLMKPHRQFRSGSGSKYDLITISERGKEVSEEP
jgi:hypothetical protein